MGVYIVFTNTELITLQNTSNKNIAETYFWL